MPIESSAKSAARDLDPRIPSSSAHEDHCISTRRRAVEENLSPSLEANEEPRYIGEDHQCFELDSVVTLCEEFGIKVDSNPWKNFKRLLCGYRDLPFIILQNPTRQHVLEYEEMKQCPTLQWISDVLGEIGLPLEDVVIVDICSLLSDDDLARMGKDSERARDAVEKPYAMVEDILEYLNPGVVIACQCVTLGQRKRINGRLKTTWGPASNVLARSLCSSQKNMRRGFTKSIHIGSNSALCVYGIHPRRLKFEGTMIPELRGTFKDVFVPCMSRFRGDEKAATAPGEAGLRSLPRVHMVTRTKADSPSDKRAIEVAVSEVGEEAGKLGVQLAALRL